MRDNMELKIVLEEYSDVFGVPNELPPHRIHDHKIKLLLNIPLINVRPNRHLSNQKDEIEHMVKELLDSGVIRHRQILFCSPIVMVKKKKDFLVENDASSSGIRAVLQQDGHPIAFLSKTLSPKHQTMSTYEKELLALLLALDRWRGYLLGNNFKIKTDHFNLKYLLDQRLTTPFQAKWLPKLLGFDYEISYKKGCDNTISDALSGCQTSAELCNVVCYTISSNPKISKQIKKASSENGHQGEKPKEWVKWLSLAEFCSVDFVNRTLQAREKAIKMLQFHWEKAQDIMRSLANKHRTYRNFELEIKDADGEVELLEPTGVLEMRYGKLGNGPLSLMEEPNSERCNLRCLWRFD
ncbi:putative mitochondrial protein [Tanacetum coccineum]